MTAKHKFKYRTAQRLIARCPNCQELVKFSVTQNVREAQVRCQCGRMVTVKRDLGKQVGPSETKEREQ